MKTYISLLRGINVGGKNIIKMSDLKQVYENLNFKNIRTYIQSGNVVFETEKSEIQEIENDISNKIFENFGFNVPVTIVEKNEFQIIVENNPFNITDVDFKNFHVTFLKSYPVHEDINKINSEIYLPDEFRVIQKSVYLNIKNGYGNTKLTNTFLESKFKTTATTRNWNTIIQLLKIL